MIEKEAQHRSLWNKVRENIDVFQGFNALLSPIYRRHLEELANIDDIFRQNALDGRIDSARKALHRARMSFKNREYPQAIAHSYTVLEVIREIFNPETIKELKGMQDQAIKDFYSANNNPEDLAKVNEEHEKYLKQNAPSVPQSAPNPPPSLSAPQPQSVIPSVSAIPLPSIPNANVIPLSPIPGTNESVPEKSLEEIEKDNKKESIKGPSVEPKVGSSDFDLISNAWKMEDVKYLPEWIREKIPTYRGMEGHVLEKIYRQQTAQYRNACREGLNITEKLFRDMERVFNKLDRERGAGKIFDYIKTVEKFDSSLRQNEISWFKVYNQSFKKDVERILGTKIDQLDHDKSSIKGLPSQPPSSPNTPALEGPKEENWGSGLAQALIRNVNEELPGQSHAPTPGSTTKIENSGTEKPENNSTQPTDIDAKVEVPESTEPVSTIPENIKPPILEPTVEKAPQENTENLEKKKAPRKSRKKPNKPTEPVVEPIVKKAPQENTEDFIPDWSDVTLVEPENTEKPSSKNKTEKQKIKEKVQTKYTNKPEKNNIQKSITVELPSDDTSQTEKELKKEKSLINLLLKKGIKNINSLAESNRIVLWNITTNTYEIIKKDLQLNSENQIILILKSPALEIENKKPTQAFDKANELVKQALLEFKENSKGSAISLLAHASQCYEDAGQIKLSIEAFNKAQKILDQSGQK